MMRRFPVCGLSTSCAPSCLFNLTVQLQQAVSFVSHSLLIPWKWLISTTQTLRIHFYIHYSMAWCKTFIFLKQFYFNLQLTINRKQRHVGTGKCYLRFEWQDFIYSSVCISCATGQLVDFIKRVEQRAPLSCDTVLKILYQTCRAVQHMHKQKPPIVHRDLKVWCCLVAGPVNDVSKS